MSVTDFRNLFPNRISKSEVGIRIGFRITNSSFLLISERIYTVTAEGNTRDWQGDPGDREDWQNDAAQALHGGVSDF